MERLETIDHRVAVGSKRISSAYVPPFQLTKGQPPPNRGERRIVIYVLRSRRRRRDGRGDRGGASSACLERHFHRYPHRRLKFSAEPPTHSSELFIRLACIGYAVNPDTQALILVLTNPTILTYNWISHEVRPLANKPLCKPKANQA